MKRISGLLLLCLFLCGCSAAQEAISLSPPPETETHPPLYSAGSNLEISSFGAVRVYPLAQRTGKAILPFRDGLLLFSEGTETTLTYLSGDALVPSYEHSLSFSLEAGNCVIGSDTLSFFHPARDETVILNERLEEVSRIPAPSGMTGAPLLSEDGKTLYYTTGDSVRLLDVATGLQRILRQTGTDALTLHSLHCGGQILRCQSETESQFLSTQTGSLLATYDRPLILATQGNRFLAASWETNLWSVIFDTGGTALQALTPRTLGCEYSLFPAQNAVITHSRTAEVTSLDLYDLTTGQRTASQMLPGSPPKSLVFQNGFYLLIDFADGTAIIRWDPGKNPISDEAIYTGPHFTAENPDREGLAQCRQKAGDIGQAYGMEVLIWEAAAEGAPDKLQIIPEHRTNILNRELELLEERLARFPPGMLRATAEHFDTVKLCLVRQMEGSPLPGGYPFFHGRTAFVFLVAGETSEQALYHSLYHLMQTHILTRSSGLDRWNGGNPQGFQYDEDFAFNATRNSGIYLAQGSRYFIDTFSMSFAKEDQARIFEYAMMDGQKDVFASTFIQQKLKTLCAAIRDAYGLETTQPLPWEQYLK